MTPRSIEEVVHPEQGRLPRCVLGVPAEPRQAFEQCNLSRSCISANPSTALISKPVGEFAFACPSLVLPSMTWDVPSRLSERLYCYKLLEPSFGSRADIRLEPGTLFDQRHVALSSDEVERRWSVYARQFALGGPMLMKNENAAHIQGMDTYQ